MFNKLAFILLLMLSLGCKTYKPIEIQLRPDDNTDGRLSLAIYLVKNLEPDSMQVLLASRLKLSKFTVSAFEHCPQKDAKNNENTLVDTLDSKTLFLTGFRTDSIYIIADENNNNSLNDDRVLVVSKKLLNSRSTKDLRELPFCSINNLQTTYEKKKYIFSKKLFLMPDTIRDKNLNLNVISNERMKGGYKYRNKEYWIRVKQPLSGYFDTTIQFVNVQIDYKRDSVNMKYNKNNILHIYDTIKKGKDIFVIQNISPLLNKIVLQPVKASFFSEWTANIKRAPVVTPIEEIKGQLYPKLEYFSDSIALLKEGGGSKVLFVNFWFANCPPCIAEFNALNNLYTRLKNNSSFKLVSLTFESPEVIQKMREKYSLLFDIYSVPKTEIQKLSLNNSYPTNIIIDKKGIVKEFYVGGEAEQEKADLFFKNEVMSGILKLLK
jgi:thiol-disulfide isomerase/thioredoxin